MISLCEWWFIVWWKPQILLGWCLIPEPWFSFLFIWTTLVFTIKTCLILHIPSAWSTYHKESLASWSAAVTSCHFLKCVVRIIVCVWAVTASSGMWEQLPWPECVPVKTHLWNHTTYSLRSDSRPAAISLPHPSLSLSLS